jgi:hypothetical protein
MQHFDFLYFFSWKKQNYLFLVVLRAVVFSLVINKIICEYFCQNKKTSEEYSIDLKTFSKAKNRVLMGFFFDHSNQINNI